MYYTVEGGYKLIGEKALLQPSYGFSTSLGSEFLTSQPLYIITLPRSIDTGIPMAESTPMPREGPTLFRPIPTPQVHDNLEPSGNEQARAQYLERQMRHKKSV